MSGRTILVVDDEPDILFMVRMILEINGYSIREATSGGQALRELAQDPPDALLLDIGLPDISGWEVLERIREEGLLPMQRVVILSAHVSPGSAERASKLGCRRFVSKPFRTDELVSALEDVFSVA